MLTVSHIEAFVSLRLFVLRKLENCI